MSVKRGKLTWQSWQHEPLETRNQALRVKRLSYPPKCHGPGETENSQAPVARGNALMNRLAGVVSWVPLGVYINPRYLTLLS